MSERVSVCIYIYICMAMFFFLLCVCAGVDAWSLELVGADGFEISWLRLWLRWQGGRAEVRSCCCLGFRV